MVGQGFYVSHFSDENDAIKVPDEFKRVIGYVGFLTAFRLDIELIEHMAHQIKNWSILLVGPEDQDLKNYNLHNLSNVYFL